MSDATQKAITALGAFASFGDEGDVKISTFMLLEALNKDLDLAGYEPSDDCVKAIDRLDEAINTAYEEDEIKDELIAEAVPAELETEGVEPGTEVETEVEIPDPDADLIEDDD